MSLSLKVKKFIQSTKNSTFSIILSLLTLNLLFKFVNSVSIFNLLIPVKKLSLVNLTK